VPTCGLSHPVRRRTELTSRQQQTQRTLLDWLRMEYGIEKPSSKLLTLTGQGKCRRKKAE
jgi:hypothetical protein